MNNSVLTGFVKRAQEYGLSDSDINRILEKNANTLEDLLTNGMFPVAHAGYTAGLDNAGQAAAEQMGVKGVQGSSIGGAIGGGTGAVAGGLLGNYLTQDPKNQTRNTLIGAGVGGVLGGSAASALGTLKGLDLDRQALQKTLANYKDTFIDRLSS